VAVETSRASAGSGGILPALLARRASAALPGRTRRPTGSAGRRRASSCSRVAGRRSTGRLTRSRTRPPPGPPRCAGSRRARRRAVATTSGGTGARAGRQCGPGGTGSEVRRERDGARPRAWGRGPVRPRTPASSQTPIGLTAVSPGTSPDAGCPRPARSPARREPSVKSHWHRDVRRPAPGRPGRERVIPDDFPRPALERDRTNSASGLRGVVRQEARPEPTCQDGGALRRHT